MMRPSFQFYAGDWQRDAALRACSVAARGLWIEMMCIMHQAEPYGYLVLNGKAIDHAQLGRMIGASAREVKRSIDELDAAGVFSKDAEGRIYSRRMVRDERLRAIRAAGGQAGAEHGYKGAEAGIKGGRPRKETGDKKPPLKPAPSSSSSSSKEAEALPDAPASGVAVGPPDCPHERIVALYHELLPTCPRVMEWTAARQGYLRQRWREKSKSNGSGSGYATVHAGVAWWREFFLWIGSSKFLTGRAASGKEGRRPFTADLEWLLKPNNFAKAIEGKYHDGGVNP
jgi:hypothetical protein